MVQVLMSYPYGQSCYGNQRVSIDLVPCIVSFSFTMSTQREYRMDRRKPLLDHVSSAFQASNHSM